MPHICIINAVYPPEPVVSAQMGRDLADYLAKEGNRVTVLCPYPSRPLGVEYPDFRKSLTARIEIEGGVKVVRLPSYVAPQSSLAARMWESWSFGREACRYLEKQVGDADIVYVNTWPLCSQALIARLCTRLGIPFVLQVQDIYPETLKTKLPKWLGMLILPPLCAWDRRTARLAAKVVVIAPRARSIYAKTRSLSSDRLELIHNWQNERLFLVTHRRGDAARQYSVSATAFSFLYLGNIGPTTDMRSTIRAFAKSSVQNSQLLIIGDGSTKPACVAQTRELGLKSVRFLSCQSPSDVPALQSMADVCLLPLQKGVALNGVPSKLPAYMFSAKPVLATVDAESDTARAISAAQCGWVGEPENVNWLAAKMAEIAALPPSVLEKMGQRGRDYGLAHYSKTEGVRKLADVVLSAAAKKRS